MNTSIAVITDTDGALARMTAVSDAYSYHVGTFVTWIREGGRDLSFDTIADYFRVLNESAYSAGTKRIKRQAVKNRLRILADKGTFSPDQIFQFENAMKRLDRDPDTRAPKVNTAAVSAGKIVSENEYEQMLWQARTARQTTFLRFLWQTGARVSELTGARICDCHLEGQTVRIRVLGKGKKERDLRITEPLYNRIREIFAGETYLFETGGGRRYRRAYVSDQVATIGRRTLGRRVSAHKFRHSFATRMIQKTRKISAVSEYLGHSSVSTTLNMYTHEELTEAELFGVEAIF